MRNRSSLILLAAALVLATVPALSEEGDIPTARQVVDRYIEAMGGEEAIRSNATMAMEGTMEMVGQGMSANIKVLAMAPNKMKMDMTIPGMGSIQSGFDGEVAWAVNPMTGPMVMDGKELAQAKRQADFYSVLHSDTLYKSMTNTGAVDFEGSSCWKVELTTHDDETITEYYNVETGLIDGMTQTQASQMGDITITTLVGDYKQFGNVMSPTKMTAKIGPGMEQVVTINSITHEGVSESEFALPSEIQALIGGGETEAEAAPEAPSAPEALEVEK